MEIVKRWRARHGRGAPLEPEAQPEAVRSAERRPVTSMNDYVGRWLALHGTSAKRVEVTGSDHKTYMSYLEIPELRNSGSGRVWEKDGRDILSYHHLQDQLTSVTFYDYDRGREIHMEHPAEIFHPDRRESPSYYATPIGQREREPLSPEDVLAVLHDAPVPDESSTEIQRRQISLADRHQRFSAWAD